MRYPTRLLGADETVVRQFRPHWQYILVPILVTFIALILSVLFSSWWDGAVQNFSLGLLVVIWLVLISGRVLNWYFTGYILTTERVIVRSGVFGRSGKEIPLEVVNDVSFQRTFFERVIGSGDLLIESAGELGQSYYKDIPKPELIQSEILRVREARIKVMESGGEKGSGSSVAEEIRALYQLFRDGAITETQYEQQKHKLLSD